MIETNSKEQGMILAFTPASPLHAVVWSKCKKGKEDKESAQPRGV
jgi:hypothetical protein